MAITIRNITKYFGRQAALSNISFQVNQGELLGFLGPNGAGKSTLMKIITGFLPADEGVVWINEEKIAVNNTAIRKNIGYLPENNPLYTDLYVREFLLLTARLYQLPEKKKRVSEIIDMVRLGDEQHKKIGALSKGYRQRVGLAQALIHDPSILILDEPTTGLDPNQLEEIRELIKKISLQKTVILSSHIMQEVEAVCSRVLIINKGKIVTDGSISDIKNRRLAKYQKIIAGFREETTAGQLLAIEGVKSAAPEGNQWIIESDGSSDIRPQIFRFAVDNSLTLLTLIEKQQNLEGIFQQLTRENAS